MTIIAGLFSTLCGRLLGRQQGALEALAQADAALATRYFTEALTLFRDQGNRGGMTWCLSGLAGVAGAGGLPERAAKLWGAGEALRLKLRSNSQARQRPPAPASARAPHPTLPQIALPLILHAEILSYFHTQVDPQDQ